MRTNYGAVHCATRDQKETHGDTSALVHVGTSQLVVSFITSFSSWMLSSSKVAQKVHSHPSDNALSTHPFSFCQATEGENEFHGRDKTRTEGGLVEEECG